MLGTLFRSRDFIKQETELVVIVTPYMVRPTARQNLARAGRRPRSRLGSEGQFPRPSQSDLRQDRSAAARRSEGRLRVHRRIAGKLEEAMRSPIAPRTASGSKPVVAQLLTVSLLAAGSGRVQDPGRRAGRPRRGLDAHRPLAAPPDHGVAAALDHERARRPRLAGADAGAEGRRSPRFLERYRVGRRRQQQAGDCRAERLAQRGRRRARGRRYTRS